MDTVLGLALTPTTIGWVMAEGQVEDCPSVYGDELGVDRDGPGLDAVSMATSVSTAVARARTMVAARGGRLHGVGVTWSDDAAVAAALLLEALADAGFDNVVPVRFSEAAASLTGGVSRRGDRTAVCVIEPGLATLVLLGGSGDDDPIVTASPIGGTDDVTDWLAGAFASASPRPDVLMVAGSMRGMDRLGRRLESKLKMPVFVQAGAQQALARGAALALAPHADLTCPPVEGVTIGLDTGPARPMSLSYAGALTMLAAGAVTFVVSLSAALSLQLGPTRDVPDVRPSERVTVARVAVPAAAPPAAPAPRGELPEAPAAAPAEFGSLWDAPAVAPAPPPPPTGQPSLLDRVRQHIPRLPGR